MRVGHPCGFHYDVTDFVLTPQDLNVMWIQSEPSRVGKVLCVLEVVFGFFPQNHLSKIEVVFQVRAKNWFLRVN
jgi:hypothetical protein